MAATDGDRVVLAPGVHVASSTIDFLGKSIEVFGEAGPGETEIQFSGGFGVVFQNGEGRDSILRGVSLVEKSVVTYGASPSVIDVWIRDVDNVGLSLNGMPPDLAGTLVQRCRITGCTGQSAGGAVITTSAELVDCVIRDNVVYGIFPAGRGGGIRIDTSGLAMIRLENCLIEGNRTEDSLGVGGGMFIVDGVVDIVNCSIVANEATPPEGGGIEVLWASVSINSSIIRENIAGGMPCQIVSASPLSITYSNIEDGAPGLGNIDADPLFVPGPLGDRYLDLGSPCVNSGDPALPLIDGTTRVDQLPDDDVVDMGYHYPIIDDRFVRGDCNADGQFDLADAIFTLSSLFVAGSAEPACESACDGNDDDSIDISDPIFSLSALLVLGSPQPTAPFPDCGPDPTLGQLECGSFAPCP